MDIQAHAAFSQVLTYLHRIESAIGKLNSQGHKLMTVMDDLKAAVANVAQDVLDEGAEVTKAIAALAAAVAGSGNVDPAVAEATAALVAAHDGFKANLATLDAALATPTPPPV